MKTIGIYHDKDLDGLMCGAIMKKAIPGIELIGWDYTYDHRDLIDKIILIDPDRIYMSDLSLPKKEMEFLALRYQFIWIDHHKTAINDLNDLPFTNSVLSTDCAACELCWGEFFVNESMHPLVEQLGKYDTWRKDEQWDSVTLPIHMFYQMPGNFNIERLVIDLDEWGWATKERAIRYGVALIEFENGILKSAWDTGQERFVEATIDVDGNYLQKIPAYIINTTVTASRMLDVCGGPGDDVLCTYYRIGASWKYSLRSRKTDVGEIARQYGGGGHKHAAGFILDYLIF